MGYFVLSVCSMRRVGPCVCNMRRVGPSVCNMRRVGPSVCNKRRGLPVKIAAILNQLPENIVSAGAVNTFKNRLDKYCNTNPQ
ncbi:hypothetical protein FHG87_023324 [Trinorchestia longiramus]|nr:hypothetical protein FHG87_023324 [Trinorchestia longiramus]